MSNILTKQIRERIEQQGENALYMVRDFADLDNDGLVTRALSRLAKEGVLVRISQGIYLYPKRNHYGILKPSIDEIATAIAQKDKARIIPSGLTALNKLGLSTQVTMNAVYLTDATAREIKIGNRTITFKRSAPRNFAYETEVFPLVVCAMKEIGEAHITKEHLMLIKEAIDKCKDKDAIRRDYNIAPGWIRKKLSL
ncbi:MAG: type IV toxin-antitoxin system AbiEi family antitoxin domain-containing protein [Bacteroidales bacterium]|nr:type IV toxin-antitoxin system AbiEi family antitoxin domain-containing protein [Candidatus Sodaliphilus aphodohippi]